MAHQPGRTVATLVIVGRGNHVVAFAGFGFQLFAIEYRNRAALVANCAAALESSGGAGYRSTASPQYSGKRIVCHRNLVNTRFVVGHQQPPTKPLLHGVKLVTHGGLRKLEKQGIRITQQDAVYHVATTELRLQKLAAHRKGTAWYLNDGTECSDILEERCYADYSFIADDANFDRLPIGSHRQTRNHRFFREINLFDPFARFVKNGVLIERQRPEVRSEKTALPCRQSF